jgi:hypothetical protein
MRLVIDAVVFLPLSSFDGTEGRIFHTLFIVLGRRLRVLVQTYDWVIAFARLLAISTDAPNSHPYPRLDS